MDKERVKELLKILDYFASPLGSEEYYFLNSEIDDLIKEWKNRGGA